MTAPVPGWFKAQSALLAEVRSFDRRKRLRAVGHIRVRTLLGEVVEPWHIPEQEKVSAGGRGRRRVRTCEVGSKARGRHVTYGQCDWFRRATGEPGRAEGPPFHDRHAMSRRACRTSRPHASTHHAELRRAVASRRTSRSGWWRRMRWPG